MKKFVPIFITMMLIGAPSGVYGQKEAEDDPVIGIFNKYEEKEGVESITISPALLGLMKNGKTGDRKTQELISKITGLRILALTDGANGKGRANREAFTAELQTVVKKDFEEIMKVKSSGERIELYVRNNPDCENCKSALLFISSASDSLTVMHLAGTIDKSLIDAVMNGEIGASNKVSK
ncbi:MAG: DUF4252 domain-containing protein [Bacteroidales bacterium]|jgi:hypothetical protein|nr:DUF4252 domain-containing protein [Bacteroidales bacterium]